MNRMRAIEFCHHYSYRKFYQPIIFIPGVLEIEGKWNTATKKLVDIILPNCAGKSVLDLGCMHGFFLHEALNRGAKRVVGVECDTSELAIAHEIQDILGTSIEFVHKKIEEYQSGHFDIVLMLNILHVLYCPKEIITHFLKIATESLVIEYCIGNEYLFPRSPDQITDSLRSSGYRKLAFFKCN